MHSIYQFLGESWLSRQAQAIPDLFAISESLHFVGLSLLLGSLLVVDLRVLGVIRGVSYASVMVFIWLAVVGFAINVATGAIFIATEPSLYETNPAFQWKLALIAVAGVNAGWFMVREHKALADLPDDAPAPLSAKWSAGLSLSVWVLVILCGRLLPTFADVGGG